jgi:hypothetical protein
MENRVQTSFLKKIIRRIRFAGLAILLILVFFAFSIFAIFSKSLKIVKNTLGMKDKATDSGNDNSFMDEILADTGHH